MLDEGTHNYFLTNLAPILLKAKLCNTVNNCMADDNILCSQGNSLFCQVYGITDPNVIKEIATSINNSGLRIDKVIFWSSTHDKKFFFETPIYQLKGNV